MLKIAFLIERLNASGMARDLQDLCRNLDKHRFQPIVISLYGPAVMDEEFSRSGIPITYAGLVPAPASLKNVTALWKLGRFLQRDQVDIVHGSHYWSSVYAVIAAKIAGGKAVTNRIDLGFYASGFVLRWLQNATNSGADAVVANCAAARDAALRNERNVAARLRLIYGGCDCDRAASGEPNASRVSLGLPFDGPIILCVANLHRCKRHDWLLRAAPQILARFPDAKFVIVGKDMGQLEHLRKMVTELNVENAVVFTGVRTDVPQLIAVATVGVLTSETEAFSNALLEYSAAGLPVVATAVGGNAEIVEDGVSGYLTPASDISAFAARICDILECPTQAMKMGAAGRTRVRSLFGVHRFVEEYERLFESLGAEAHSRTPSGSLSSA